MESFKENLTRKMYTFSFMHIWKFLNQSVSRIGEQNGKSFTDFSGEKKERKKRKEKNITEQIEFHNSIQD